MSVDNSAFSRDCKWSKRLKSLALAEGVHLTEDYEAQIKIAIANLIPNDITDFDSIFIDVKLDPIRSLALGIEQMLN